MRSWGMVRCIDYPLGLEKRWKDPERLSLKRVRAFQLQSVLASLLLHPEPFWCRPTWHRRPLSLPNHEWLRRQEAYHLRAVSVVRRTPESRPTGLSTIISPKVSKRAGSKIMRLRERERLYPHRQNRVSHLHTRKMLHLLLLHLWMESQARPRKNKDGWR